jgi:C-terminal processing protease CtpA/Prc
VIQPTTTEFLESGMDCLLAPLRDYHVAIQDDTGEFWGYGLDGYIPNYDTGLIALRLDAGSAEVTGAATTGTLEAGSFGYIRVDSWVRSDLGSIDIPGLVDAVGPVAGMVIDMRTNSGGDESAAQELAGRFVSDTTTAYDFAQVRDEQDGDPVTHELGPQVGQVLPASVVGAQFGGPVALLIGNKCLSSCEHFVAMMALAPQVRRFGETTRGGTGNPRFDTLSDDATVLISSTWLITLPDGTVLEWNGIAPDEQIDFVGAGGDEVLDAAVDWLLTQ